MENNIIKLAQLKPYVWMQQNEKTYKDLTEDLKQKFSQLRTFHLTKYSRDPEAYEKELRNMAVLLADELQTWKEKDYPEENANDDTSANPDNQVLPAATPAANPVVKKDEPIPAKKNNKIWGWILGIGLGALGVYAGVKYYERRQNKK